MALKMEVYEKMCAYFDGELSLEEEKKFLELLENDPELKEEFEWEEKMIFNSVPHYQEESVIASDSGIGELPIYKEPFLQKPVILQAYFYKRWALVASVVAIITLIAFATYVYNNSATKLHDLTKDNDRVPGVHNPVVPNNPILDTPGKAKQNEMAIASARLKRKKINNLGRHEPDVSVESPQLGQIQEAFVDKDYAGVVTLAKKDMQVRGNENDAEEIAAYAIFYKGIAWLELDNDSAAISVLQIVSQKEKAFPLLAQEASWNLGKAYFKSGNTAEAKKIVQALLRKKDFAFAEAAKELLKMIAAEEELR